MAKNDESASVTGENVNDSLQWGLTLLKRSIHELMGSLSAIQKPLTESKWQLPQATSQLDRISEQTEQATKQVLDLVEKIGEHQSDVIDLLNQSINTLRDTEDVNLEVIAKLEAAEEHANRTQNDTYTIMDALQFQDITAQQINHAASLLEEVEGKIENIVGQLDMGDGEGEAVQKQSKNQRAFNPNADMLVKQTNQAGIDSLVKSSRAKTEE